MWPNPQKTVDLVIFAEEIVNGKLYFCAVRTCIQKAGIVMYLTRKWCRLTLQLLQYFIFTGNRCNLFWQHKFGWYSSKKKKTLSWFSKHGNFLIIPITFVVSAISFKNNLELTIFWSFLSLHKKPMIFQTLTKKLKKTIFYCQKLKPMLRIIYCAIGYMNMSISNLSFSLFILLDPSKHLLVQNH